MAETQDIDTAPWRHLGTKDKIPKFRSQRDCKLHAADTRHLASNPLGRPYCQYVSVVVGKAQLCDHVFPALNGLRRRIQYLRCDEVPPEPSFAKRLSFPLYKALSPLYAFEATLRTWSYLYNRGRCGIFVKITAGRLALFIPFVNPDFTNKWKEAGTLKFSLDGKTAVSHRAYLDAKNKWLRWPEDLIEDPSKWWSNGAVICNVAPPNGWGDAFLPQLRDMFQATCETHDIPDVEFFFNKRDNPVLRHDRQSPCPLDPKGSPVLTAPAYAPVMGFYSGKAFSDLVAPTSEDWEVATGDIFPPYGFEGRMRHVVKDATGLPWGDRKPMAVFRGSATGAGVDLATNLRLALAAKTLPRLDAGIVKWAIRDKVSNGFIRFLDPSKMPFELSPYMTFKDQCSHKVLIYVDGHAAANRLGLVLKSGSLMLRLLPDDPSLLPPGHDSWLTQFLAAYPWQEDLDSSRCESKEESHHYNHIACRLGDLEDALEWVWSHDEIAERLASNAKTLAMAVLSTTFITTYLARSWRAIHAKTKGGTQPALFPPGDTAYGAPLFW